MSSREEMKARYELFDRHALNDQRSYYRNVVDSNRRALGQVNLIRASLSLFTGLAAALAAVLGQAYFVGDPPQCVLGVISCGWIDFTIMFCIIVSIALPALGGFFNSMMDLYQWDRLSSLYESAVENITVADALSPDEEQPDPDYQASFFEYVKGTLQVMSDETAQWGQSIRTPRSVEKMVEDSGRTSNEVGGNADAARAAANNPPPAS